MTISRIEGSISPKEAAAAERIASRARKVVADATRKAPVHKSPSYAGNGFLSPHITKKEIK